MRLLTHFVALCISVACAPALATLIDFEDLPGDTIVTTQYSSLGVLFSLIDSPQAGPLIQADGTNVIVPSSDLQGGAFDFDIQIDFVRRALSAAIRVLDAEEPFVMYAYDGATQVGIATVQSDGRGPGGPAYIASFSAAPFDRLIIDLTNDLGSGAGGPEAYDNLRFELGSAPTAVAEPGTLLLLSVGGLALLGASRRNAAPTQ